MCRVYGSKQITSIDQSRLALFSKAYKCTENEELFHKNAKKLDASTLPPCHSELHQHLRRTAYITNIWRNAHLQSPTNLSPVDYGWVENDGRYEFKWFEGDQLPTTVNEIVLDTENATNEGICPLFSIAPNNRLKN